MRFDSLHLSAVGPFTDRALDLSAGREGVHAIYGRNEAGKSSSLRAVRALLFGFEKNSTDNFVHNYEQLRVGAAMRVSDGSTLTCYRRKGIRNTLLDAQGELVDDGCLDTLLHGMTEIEFIHLFGIDHQSLVQGGLELLKTHGREAEALFSSGIGSSALPQVRKQLETEANALFSARGSKPLINALGRELDELRKAEREVTLLASHWDEARRTVERISRELVGIGDELGTARSRHRELARLRRVLPLVVKHTDLLGKIAAVGDVVTLADDFSARRVQAQEQQRAAVQDHAGAQARIERARLSIESLVVDDVLLAQHEILEALHERLSVKRKAMDDRRGLAREGEQLLTHLGELKASLGATWQTDGFESALLLQTRLDELTADKQARDPLVVLLQKQLTDAERLRTVQQRELDALLQQAELSISTTVLSDAVHLARSAADIDSRLTSMQIVIQTHARKCNESLSTLGRWQKTEDELLRTAMPDDGAVVAMQEQFAKFDERAVHLENRQAELTSRHETERVRLAEILADGAVPAADELTERRALRDAGWRLLRAQWIDGEDVAAAASEFSAENSLPDAYEHALRAADDVADRLWLHAAKVQDLESAKREARAITRQLDTGARHKAELDAQWLELHERWIDVWRALDLVPGTPSEMLRWLSRARELREQVRALRDEQDELDVLQRSRMQHVARLRAALQEAPPEGSSIAGHSGEHSNDGLSGILARAEQQLVAIDDHERDKAALAQAVVKLGDAEAHANAQLKAVCDELVTWQRQWDELAIDLGAAAGVSPTGLAARMSAIREVVRLSKVSDKQAQRISDIDADAAQFDADARALCDAIASTLATDRVAEDAVRYLHSRLREQQKLHTHREALVEEAQKAEQERDTAAANKHVAQMSIEQLCVEAGGVKDEALIHVEILYAQRYQLDLELAQCEQELYTQGDGETLDALVAIAKDVDMASVIAELSALGEKIDDELQPRRDALFTRKLDAQRALDDMIGDGEAANIALQIQQKLAEIREKASDYVRLKLASRVLSEQVERFRAMHRDPILAAAGRYLSTLTLGDYCAVQTRFDSADQAILCVLRKNSDSGAAGAQLTVDALSTGTRDQLFLALRLAALERYLDGGAEALPLIVDDILVQFDDRRAHATLKALAEFSTRTQVLLFTHHERIAHDAVQLEHHAGGVHLHRL